MPVDDAGSSLDATNPVLATLSAFFYLVLATVFGSLSQLVLSPVFGSIASSAQHSSVTRWAVLLAVLAKPAIKRSLPPNPRKYLPLLAFYVPVAQYFLAQDSTRLGPTSGPVAIETFTHFPLVLLATVSASDSLETIQAYRSSPILRLVVGAAFFGGIYYGEPRVTEFFAGLPARADLPDFLLQLGSPEYMVSRVNLQLVAASSAVMFSPSIVNFLAIPAVIHTTMYNTHFKSSYSDSLLNTSLHAMNWSLLARQESVTGYISVLENLEDNYRVLRCDHSLLGGEWQLSAQRISEGATGTEPIYGVFEMLEAVRLVEAGVNEKPDSDKSALVIGQGVGTAPKALLAHGIATTVVELDPIVQKYATEYFGLPTNHTSVIQDAVTWVSEQVSHSETQPRQHRQRYDYILLDVFTGGAEPLALFADSFLRNLVSLLSPDGVVAIVYGGDASLTKSPTKQVLYTINKIFGRTCRVFRDAPPTTEAGDPDFANMVVYCLHPAPALFSEQETVGAGPWPEPGSEATMQESPRFRVPNEDDFLSSQSRRMYMAPKPELELGFPSAIEMEGEKVKVLTQVDVDSGVFYKEQLESSMRHWRIMRKVVPAKVWEMW